MRPLVVIPTYNEIENIEKILKKILSQDPRLEILVVDDSSPDGTGEKVLGMRKADGRIHLKRRSGKLGLGTAYVEGFKWAIEHKYDCVFEMDADFSHDPAMLPVFLEEIKKYDLVIGSRYINGVSVINWPMSRLLLSYFANKYASLVTGCPIKDLTGGFKCFRRETLEAIDLDKVHSDGYSFQIEIDFKVYAKGFRIKEIPIIFADRTEGKSKMSKKIVWEAIFMVWRLRLARLFRKL
ncbi:polyprenol monophosphomannose synthase [candidate division WOR-3 bacterium]|nr:polyprenol monophosphomannose synthase [candidate division WOR-3 bacterium]